MKNLTYLLVASTIFIFSIISPVVGQTTSITSQVPILDSAYVASKTSYFIIENNKISGTGLAVLNQIVKESQFVVLGERHGTSQTSKLTAAMIPLLKKADYDNFAIEVGPSSAKKLMDLSEDAKNTRQNLNQFLNHYYKKEIGDIPIPFFSGIEDAAFLQAAAESEIELWGLDQEYYTSTLFLMDELLELARGKSNFAAIEKMKIAAYAVVRELYIKDNNSDDIKLFTEFEKSEELTTFFDQFDESTPEALQIIDDLKFTWDIYKRWRHGSHDDRISYIRNNFMKNYQAKAKTGKLPKVLLKLGSLHCPQIVSNGCYDIGYLTNELASQNGTQCANVRMESRFFEQDGIVSDYLEKSIYYQRLEAFTLQAHREQWAIVNLQDIRSDIAKGLIRLPLDGAFHDLKSLIDGFDYQIFHPVDRYVEPNFVDE